MSRSRISWLLSLAASFIALTFSVSPGASDTPKKGGLLRIGMIGEPPTLVVPAGEGAAAPRDGS